MLRRNILQAGEGGAGSANEFLQGLSKDGTSWPIGVLRGIVLECFTNEKNEIRFKRKYMAEVLASLADVSAARRSRVVSSIMDSIKAGNPKACVERDDFDETNMAIGEYSWVC